MATGEACKKRNLESKSINLKRKRKDSVPKDKNQTRSAETSNNLLKKSKNVGDDRAAKLINCKRAKRKIRLKYRKQLKAHSLNDVEENSCKNEDASEKADQKPERIRLPSKPEEISCNWMKLSQSLEKSKPKSRKHTKTKKDDTNEIWFDGVDKVFLQSDEPEKTDTVIAKSLVKDHAFKGLTQSVALDCEMVGVGENGRESHLARVSIVNHFGHCIYDKYVKPQEKVTDYRTQFSGIRPEILNKKGEEFNTVVQEVSDIIKKRILVGHALRNDLKVLFLSHPRKRIRDTSRFKYFRSLFKGQIPSLKKLSEKLLGVKIQDGEHDSVQDAQAAMRLYTMHKKQWEKDIKQRRHRKTDVKQDTEKDS